MCVCSGLDACYTVQWWGAGVCAWGAFQYLQVAAIGHLRHTCRCRWILLIISCQFTALRNFQVQLASLTHIMHFCTETSLSPSNPSLYRLSKHFPCICVHLYLTECAVGLMTCLNWFKQLFNSYAFFYYLSIFMSVGWWDKRQLKSCSGIPKRRVWFQHLWQWTAQEFKVLENSCMGDLYGRLCWWSWCLGISLLLSGCAGEYQANTSTQHICSTHLPAKNQTCLGTFYWSDVRCQ